MIVNISKDACTNSSSCRGNCANFFPAAFPQYQLVPQAQVCPAQTQQLVAMYLSKFSPPPLGQTTKYWSHSTNHYMIIMTAHRTIGTLLVNLTAHKKCC